MFAKLLGKSIEIYIDEMLVKRRKMRDHVQHLREAFKILCRYQMKLNPKKCLFGVSVGKFLSYMVIFEGLKQ